MTAVPTLNEILWAIVQDTQVTKEQMLSPQKTRYMVYARQRFAAEAQEQGYTGTQIGAFMGISRQEALGHARRFKERLNGK